jgi:hypothetical protein
MSTAGPTANGVASAGAARTDAVGILGVVLVSAVAAFAAAFEVLLVPLYAGRVLVPVAVLLAIAGNLALPRMARTLVGSTWAAAAPVVVWLVVTVALGFTSRPEGDVLLPGGGYVQWVGFGVFLGGLAAGLASIILTLPPPRPRTPRT